ncbi:STAS-like domain-containing protein [Candidatus Saccharibacteria bacterium]|nr:STAS-like domain-containing protein [Candidatus Saccharibacteria bacterium]
MKKIIMEKEAGRFCENKDIAKKLREEIIEPTIREKEPVIIDFGNVSGATQSFIHALVSNVIREYRDQAFDNLLYKNACLEIQKIISIVYNYMQLD